MGHLISARAFRLGVSMEWMDIWFSLIPKVYILFLFTCFRLRYFILSYIMQKGVIKAL
jgi:hypothetical protein